jgi:hypothetical protein
MRKIIGALLASALFVSGLAALPAGAAERVVVYPLENPSSVETNQEARNTRLSQGAFVLAALGQSAAEQGIFAGCSVTGQSGTLNVLVEPQYSNEPCALWQMQAVDSGNVPATMPPSVSGSTLSPNNTQLPIDGEQYSVAPALGPLGVPGAKRRRVCGRLVGVARLRRQ